VSRASCGTDGCGECGGRPGAGGALCWCCGLWGRGGAAGQRCAGPCLCRAVLVRSARCSRCGCAALAVRALLWPGVRCSGCSSGSARVARASCGSAGLSRGWPGANRAAEVQRWCCGLRGRGRDGAAGQRCAGPCCAEPCLCGRHDAHGVGAPLSPSEPRSWRLRVARAAGAGRRGCREQRAARPGCRGCGRRPGAGRRAELVLWVARPGSGRRSRSALCRAVPVPSRHVPSRACAVGTMLTVRVRRSCRPSSALGGCA